MLIFPIGSNAFRHGEPGSLEQKGQSRRAPPDIEKRPISVYPTIFPTAEARLQSDHVRRKLLAGTGTKDIHHCPPMLNRAKTILLVKNFQSVLIHLKQASINLQLQWIFNELDTDTEPEISVELWAALSLRLERLLKTLKGYNNQNLQGLPSLPYIKLNIERLETVSRYYWKQCAHEQLIKFFSEQIKQLENLRPPFNEM